MFGRLSGFPVKAPLMIVGIALLNRSKVGKWSRPWGVGPRFLCCMLLRGVEDASLESRREPLHASLPLPPRAWPQSFSLTPCGVGRHCVAKGNFRLSAWWFGLLPLIRGFGFAFSIVVATNVPAVQVAIASVLLLAYVILQALLQPWKARLTNIMDLLLSAMLLLLIRASVQEDREKEKRFAEVWTLITLCLLTFFLVFMICTSLLALYVEWRGHDSEPLLNMSGSWVVGQEVQALKNCAEALLEAEADQLMSGLKKLNPYDLKQLANTIEIFDDLLVTNFSSSSTRLREGGINRGLTVVADTGALAPKESEEEEEDVAEANAPEPGVAVAPSATDEPDERNMVSLEC